jgi:ribonuclease VapC
VIVDSSAVVAIVRAEPEAEGLLETMRDAEGLWMATPTALELTMVLGAERIDRAMDLLRQLGVRLVEFDSTHLAIAQHAFATYGRGSGSAAKLNFGDCITYALAKATGESLLFKGDDFTHTDIVSARD